jgi:hypothetical protein
MEPNFSQQQHHPVQDHHPEVARELRKNRLLEEVQFALQDGTITADELQLILPHNTPVPSVIPGTSITTEQAPATSTNQVPEPAGVKKKLSAVEIMFYIAGIILFASLMTFVAESWGDGIGAEQIMLSAGIGTLLWILAAVLNRTPNSTEIRKGLVNSLILTGSLSVITGGFIILDLIVGDNPPHILIPAAITLAILGSLHFAYDRIVRKDLILLLAVFISVASFPLLLSGIVEPLNPGPDIYAVITIFAALLLVFATRTAFRVLPDRQALNHPFDGLAAFAALATMFAASFDDYGLIWLILLIGSVFSLFYLSIIRRSKDLLGNASLFLVVSVLTIAFKYFSGFGAGFSLIIAAGGLLGTAAMASSINKKYFKPPQS